MTDIRRLAGWALLSASLLVTVASAVEDEQRVEQVKAAFIVNIARFVTWPEDEGLLQPGRHLLCLYRGTFFDDAMNPLQDAKLSGQRLQVIEIQRMDQSDACTILFLSNDELASFQGELPMDWQRPLLTILDRTDKVETDGLSRRGVMVSMVRDGTRIALEVDLAQTRKAGLAMSSHLLKLVRIVGAEAKP